MEEMDDDHEGEDAGDLNLAEDLLDDPTRHPSSGS